MADMNKVGKRICKYREQMGLTQEQLSINSGISLDSIKEYEEGIAYPPIGSLIRLSRSLGLIIKEPNKPMMTKSRIMAKRRAIITLLSFSVNLIKNAKSIF